MFIENEGYRESDVIQDINYESSNIVLLNLDIVSSLIEGKNIYEEGMCFYQRNFNFQLYNNFW